MPGRRGETWLSLKLTLSGNLKGTILDVLLEILNIATTVDIHGLRSALYSTCLIESSQKPWKWLLLPFQFRKKKLI